MFSTNKLLSRWKLLSTFLFPRGVHLARFWWGRPIDASKKYSFRIPISGKSIPDLLPISPKSIFNHKSIIKVIKVHHKSIFNIPYQHLENRYRSFFSIHIKYYNYKATFYYTTRLTMQHYRDDAKRSTGK